MPRSESKQRLSMIELAIGILTFAIAVAIQHYLLKWVVGEVSSNWKFIISISSIAIAGIATGVYRFSRRTTSR